MATWAGVPCALTISLNWAALSTSTFLVTEDTDSLVMKLTFSFPPDPFLVVIMITPFDALVPYIAAADASFRMVKDSMSLGLIKLKGFDAPGIALVVPVMGVLSIGTPSITMSGSLLALS